MAKSCVVTHYSNSINQLNLPQRIKENLEHHNHFDATIDEIEDKNKFSRPNGLDHFSFKVSDEILLLTIINWDINKLAKSTMEFNRRT